MIATHLRHFNRRRQWDVRQVLPIDGFLMSAPHLRHSDDKLHGVIATHLRHFNRRRQWDVRQVLPIDGFLMSAPHLRHSDDKLHGVIATHLRHFNRRRQWDVRQVLPIHPNFMSRSGITRLLHRDHIHKKRPPTAVDGLSLYLSLMRCRRLLVVSLHYRDEVENLVRVTPLVVIP